MQTSANNSTRLCYSKKNLLIRELFVYEPIKKDPKLFDLSPSRIPLFMQTLEAGVACSWDKL